MWPFYTYGGFCQGIWEVAPDGEATEFEQNNVTQSCFGWLVGEWYEEIKALSTSQHLCPTHHNSLVLELIFCLFCLQNNFHFPLPTIVYH